MFARLSFTNSSLLRRNHPLFLLKTRKMLVRCWLGKPLCLNGQTALATHQVLRFDNTSGHGAGIKKCIFGKSRLKICNCDLRVCDWIWNIFLQMRLLIQLQLASIHHITDAKLRWEIQLEDIRTHLLYGGVCTTLNGLELVRLLSFIVVPIQM